MKTFAKILNETMKKVDITNSKLGKKIRSVKQSRSIDNRTSENTISHWRNGTIINHHIQKPGTRRQILDMIQPLRLNQQAGLDTCNELLKAAKFHELDVDERKKYFPMVDKVEEKISTPNTILPNPLETKVKIEVIQSSQPLNPLLRKELLNKIDKKCTIQLKSINWLATQVSVNESSDKFPLTSNKFLQLFEHDFIVLLGEAGIGKSLAVHYIAKKLITKARKNLGKPIPLIFHLADWATKSLSFKNWLKQQLTFLGMAEKCINSDFETLVSEQRCIFFLDGFDNLYPHKHDICLREINDFIRKFGEYRLAGMVIISRPDEYKHAEQLLSKELQVKKNNVPRFHTIATIQTLDFDYVKNYLTERNYDLPLEMSEENKFTQILNRPFGLILLEDYHDDSHDADVKTKLISSYIDKRFTENETNSPYTKREVVTWLGHIAKFTEIGETFKVETLSPIKVLNEKQQHQYQWWFAGMFGIIFGLMMGSIGGLLFGERLAEKNIDNNGGILPSFMANFGETIRHWVNDGSILEKFSLIISYASIAMLCSLFMSILSFALFNKLLNFTSGNNIVNKTIERSNFAFFLGGYFALFLGITGWLVDGWEWGIHVFILYGTLGVLIGLMTGSSYTDALTIKLQRNVWFSYKVLFQQLHRNISSWLFIPLTVLIMFGFSFIFEKLSVEIAISQGFIIGISFTIGYNFYLLRTEVDWENKDFLPSQKINVALKRILLIFIMTSLIITVLVTSLSLFILDWPGNLSIGLRVGLQMGVILSFIFYGGTEVLKYFVLRWFMYQQGMTPKNYIKFLEYCKQLTFLESRSGGYAFHHDWFQEYFRKVD